MNTILNLLREQFEEDEYVIIEENSWKTDIAGVVPETSLEWEPILKERGGFWRGQRWIFA